MTASTRSLLLSAFVIIALAATIVYLLPARQKPAAGAPQQLLVHASSEAGRQDFVADLQRRFSAKAQAVTVDADGAGYTTLHLRWTPGKVDREHMDQLKRAAPFKKEARGHGFTRMLMQVGERIVWQENL